MRYTTADAFRVALDTRLRRRAANSGALIPRVRKYVAFERLMARLEIVAPDRYVLKGGYALELRLSDRARSTQDLDLAVAGGESEVVRDLTRACALDLGDYFGFEFKRTTALDNLDEATAVRFAVQSFVADKRFEAFRLDIGVEGLGTGSTDVLIGRDFLAFAEIALVEVHVIPLPQHLAEKLHAYTKTYGEDRGSSRVKDLVDMVLIAELLTLEAAGLSAALGVTFAKRGLQTIPRALPRPPDDWAVPYRRLASEVRIDPDVEVGWRAAAGFLDPVLGGEASAGAVWSPGERRWVEGPAAAG